MLKLIVFIFWTMLYGAAMYMVVDAIRDPQGHMVMKLSIAIFMLVMVFLCHHDYCKRAGGEE